jgi:hypothetical protein
MFTLTGTVARDLWPLLSYELIPYGPRSHKLAFFRLDFGSRLTDLFEI